MGLPIGAGGVMLAAIVYRSGIALLELAWVSSLQQLVPKDALGRVSSVDAMGSYAPLPVRYAAAGWAKDRSGASDVLLVGGLVSPAIIAVGFLHPGVRSVD